MRIFRNLPKICQEHTLFVDFFADFRKIWKNWKVVFLTLNICRKLRISVIPSSQWNMSSVNIFLSYKVIQTCQRLIFFGVGGGGRYTKIGIVHFLWVTESHAHGYESHHWACPVSVVAQDHLFLFNSRDWKVQLAWTLLSVAGKWWRQSK